MLIYKFLFRLLSITIILFSLPVVSLAANTITLTKVFNSTKEFFPLIKASEENIVRAYGKLRAAKGAFDPYFDSILKGEPVGGYENISNENEIKIPLTYANSNFFVGYRNGRGDWPSYYQYYRTNTGGDLILGFDVSLLKDFKTDVNRTAFTKAKTNVLLAKNKLTKVQIDTLENAGKMYWNWAAAAQKLQLAQHLLSLAKERQKALVKRVQLGDSANIDLVENKRLILQRQSNLNFASLAYQNASELLSLYYRKDNGKPCVPNIQQSPKYLPAINGLNSLQNNRHKLFLSVYKYNPELKIMNQKIHLNALSLNLARNNLLPSLNAHVSTDREFGDDGDPRLTKTALNLGLRFSVDLPRNIAKGHYSKEKAKLYQLQQRKIFLKQNLKVKLNSLLNALANDKKQVKILTNEAQLAKQIEVAERVKFFEGDSSLFLVNQREQSTFTIQIEAIDAKIAFYKSRLQLEALCAFDSECSKLI